MDKREFRASAQQLRRYLGNMTRAKVLGRQQVLPHIALFYVTHRCQLNCSFCSRKAEVLGSRRLPIVQIGSMREAETAPQRDVVVEADLNRTREILAAIREITPALYVTGGEPLILRDIVDRLRIAKELGFHPIAMNTTAVLYHKRPGLLDALDLLVVSLHTTNHKRLAETYGVEPKEAERVLESLKDAAERARSSRTEVMANCVLTEENVEDAHRVMDFCLEHGITLAIVPAINDQQPSIQSAGEAQRRAYDAFIARAVEVKRCRPASIQGPLMYLEQIRSLRQVPCRPSNILSIAPDGQVIDSCEARYGERVGKPVGPGRSVLSVLQQHFDFGAAYQPCPENCLKACHTQPALAAQHPFAALLEYLPAIHL